MMNSKLLVVALVILLSMAVAESRRHLAKRSLFRFVRAHQKTQKASKLAMLKNKQRVFSNYRFANMQQSPEDLMSMGIAKQGWVKFFTFDDKAPLERITFFDNPEWHENNKIFGSESSTDSDAPVQDPEEASSDS